VETKKEATAIQVGAPFPEFEATVETLLKLKEEGRHFLFLAAPYSLRLIGDLDKLRIDLSKKLGKDTLTKREANQYVDEVVSVAQVSLWSEEEQRAVRILADNVFKDELRKAKDQAGELRHIIGNKVACVTSKLITRSMRERAKRLSRSVGPQLSDLEVDLIQLRDAGSAGGSVATPFLRLGLRYLQGTGSGLFFSFPPWITEVEAGTTRRFDLDCDESDIDLLVSRLLLAKRLLAHAIEEKIAKTGEQKTTMEE
jgi:hypothetical protein